MARVFAVTGAFAVAGTLAAASASAQDKSPAFGEAGTIMISAERVSPLLTFQSWTAKRDQAGTETTNTDSTLSASLFFNPGALTTFHSVPRLALDVAVAQNITVGGSIFGYFTLNAKREVKVGGSSQSEDSSKLTIIGVAPRVGYVISLGDTLAFWPRVGVTYLSATSTSPPDTTGGVTTESSSKTTQFAVQIEPMFVIIPVKHFGFNIGPVIDLPVTGKRTSEVKSGGTTSTTEGDSSQLYVGLTAGLTGYF